MEVTMVEWEPSDLQPLTLEDVQLWKRVYWAELERRIGPFFARSEARVRALTYIGGLLSPAERKTSWQLAELNGDPNPYAFQHLLGRANWNADDLRDALRTYIVDHLADQDAIGVIDETGFLKKRYPLCWRCTSIQRNGWQDRELSDRRVFGLCE
jgi:hypothetical protein